MNNLTGVFWKYGAELLTSFTPLMGEQGVFEGGIINLDSRQEHLQADRARDAPPPDDITLHT